MTGPFPNSRRGSRRLIGLVAVGMLVGGACSTEAPDERSFCDHLAEIDGTGGALTGLNVEDPVALADAAQALRDASRAAPEDLSDDVLALVRAFGDLEKNADGQDPVGMASRLREQRAALTTASRNITGHAESECGISLGQS